MNSLHQTNILFHVIFGTLALLLGITALVTTKGAKWHKKAGHYFLVCITIVVITGLIGVFVYGRNTFLLLITILSAYVSISGFRVLKVKSNQLKRFDLFLILICLSTLFYFLYFFQKIGMIWSPIVIYSTVGALVLVMVYDLSKPFISKEYYKKKKIWLFEHIYKMVSAYSAIFSAFSGTVFEEYQPHSQYLPSALGSFTIIWFISRQIRASSS